MPCAKPGTRSCGELSAAFRQSSSCSSETLSLCLQARSSWDTGTSPAAPWPQDHSCGTDLHAGSANSDSPLPVMMWALNPLLNMQLLGHPQCFVSYAEPWLTRFTSLILLPCLNVCGEYSFISSLSCSLIILLFTIIAVFNSNTLLLLRVFPLQWLWVQLGGLGGEWNFLPFLTGLQSNKFESLFYLNLLFQPTYAACGHH